MLREVAFLLLLLAGPMFSQRTHHCNPNAPCGCSSKPAIVSRIVGGENAEMNSWGWAVALHYGGEYFCGGSILSEWWILTAAHCLAGLNSELITVSAGSNRLSSVNQRRTSEYAIIHPGYDTETYDNDIGLIKLRSPLNMSDPTVARLCLPMSTNRFYPPTDTNLVVVGWGQLGTELPISNELKQVTLQVLSSTDERCEPLLSDGNLQFCAADPMGIRDSCYGDSGGSIMLFSSSRQWISVGLVSFGMECADPMYAGVYTRVNSYLSWIFSHNLTGIVTADSSAVFVGDPLTTINPNSHAAHFRSSFFISLSLSLLSLLIFAN